MVLSLSTLIDKYNMTINGVLHIGAHYGQEIDVYIDNNIRNVYFFEPMKQSYNILCSNIELKKKKFDEIKTFNIAIGECISTVEMYTETANDGMSSSILKPHIHTHQYPGIIFNGTEKVNVDTLDNICIDDKYNFINMDVQGYEMCVLRGGKDTLNKIDYIYTEVNRDELYVGCARISDIDEYLKLYNFIRVETDWCGGTWGDALYLKNDKL